LTYILKTKQKKQQQKIFILLIFHFRQHRGKIIGLAFSPAGDYLFSACSLGSLALYDATADNFPLLRLLANTVARGERRGPEALSVSPDGRRMVFIGPSEFIVSVVDSKSLDEVNIYDFLFVIGTCISFYLRN
jgi:WD40 repeat protein